MCDNKIDIRTQPHLIPTSPNMSAYNYLLDINNLCVNQPSATFFTKDQARSIALLAITIISSTFETKLFGARNPPTQSDALVKLFSRRLRVDEVTLRLAKMIIDGRATKEERNWFRSLVVCFDGMVARDGKLYIPIPFQLLPLPTPL